MPFRVFLIEKIAFQKKGGAWDPAPNFNGTVGIGAMALPIPFKN
jgi:hypothetical protein